MRRISIVGGLLLALAAATSTMAAAPAPARVASASPAVLATTLTWKAAYAKSTISGTTYVVGNSTYSTDRVTVRAKGIKSGATVTLRVFYVASSKTHTVSLSTVKATLTSTGQFVKSWNLTTAQRAAFKYAVSHKFPVYFRLIDGTIMATGRLFRI